MDDKIWQEFYCNDCDGYFRVKLNMGLNIRVEMVCPNCERHHPRCVKDGRIFEYADVPTSPVQEILVPKSAYSRHPLSANIQTGDRHGAVISDAQHIRDAMLRELWMDRFGGGQCT